MKQHTPGPWRTAAWSSHGTTSILSGGPGLRNTIYVAECSTSLGSELDEANAAHIVKCVNAHDELVAALRGMERFFGQWPEFVPSPEATQAASEAVRAMNAALSKMKP